MAVKLFRAIRVNAQKRHRDSLEVRPVTVLAETGKLPKPHLESITTQLLHVQWCTKSGVFCRWKEFWCIEKASALQWQGRKLDSHVGQTIFALMLPVSKQNATAKAVDRNTQCVRPPRSPGVQLRYDGRKRVRVQGSPGQAHLTANRTHGPETVHL